MLNYYKTEKGIVQVGFLVNIYIHLPPDPVYFLLKRMVSFSSCFAHYTDVIYLKRFKDDDGFNLF